MSLRPLHDRILVQQLDAEDTVKGGLIIPDTAKEKPQEGIIRAVGNGKILDNGERMEMTVKAGDRILFGKYSGSEVTINEKEFMIMREDDVLAVLVDDTKTKSKRK